MKATGFIAAIVLFALPVCLFASKTCDDVIFSVDVSTTLGSTNLKAYQAIECKSNNYVSPIYFSGQGLTSSVNVVTIAALPTYKKAFVFTTDASFTVSSTYCPTSPCTFSTRDVVKAVCISGPNCTTTAASDTWNYSVYESSSALGMPSGTVIDSLALDTDGKLLFSFDASTKLNLTSGGTYTFLANDIVKLDTDSPSATYSMFLQGGAIGLSAGTNVVGFDLTATDYYFMFETTTTISGQSYRAGSAYRRNKTSGWAGTADPLFYDSSFPSGSIGTDFTLLPSPGEVPENKSDGNANVQITKNGNNIDISWSAGCGSSTTGYAVYEGTIGSYTSHLPAYYTNGTTVCGASSSPVTIQPSSGDKYYIVVPVNSQSEGSYGTDSSGNERSQSASPCLAKKKASSCS